MDKWAASSAANAGKEYRLPNGQKTLHDQLDQVFAACTNKQAITVSSDQVLKVIGQWAQVIAGRGIYSYV